jgi:protein-disulfide isomerase
MLRSVPMRPIRAVASSILTLIAIWVGFPTVASPQELQQITRAGERAILTKPGIEMTGSLSPDVTIVEYFDYNCPYCRQIVPTFRTLIASDRKIALVYKDWPVLGEVSVYAARCALAAHWQGKYLVAHDALLTGPRLSQNAQVESTLRAAGIDVELLKKDLTSHAQEITSLLARNDAEAHALELDGTPGILVGRQLMPGGADLNFFVKLIAEVRRGPK